MRGGWRWGSAVVLALGLAAALGGCRRRGGGDAGQQGESGVTVGPENIVLAREGVVQSGPTISGSLEPERQATLRAQVAGPILQTYAEQGQAVKRGELLVRIDDTALRDAYLSAEAAVRNAQQASDLAERNLERSKTLHAAGAISDRDLETAQAAATSAAAALADARSRLALARKQLDDTQVRSPMTGAVSSRAVSAGDVVQPGGALITVVDPTSLRLQASVPSDRIGAVRLGASVQFQVSGYPGRMFEGKVTRIAPAADPTTRQVPIYVSIPNSGGTLVSGLYAQGRVASETRTGVVVPAAAVQQSGPQADVLQIKGGMVKEVPVQLGLQDTQAETVQILSGVSPGDTLLNGAALGITPGTSVRVESLKETQGTGTTSRP